MVLAPRSRKSSIRCAIGRVPVPGLPAGRWLPGSHQARGANSRTSLVARPCLQTACSVCTVSSLMLSCGISRSVRLRGKALPQVFGSITPCPFITQRGILQDRRRSSAFEVGCKYSSDARMRHWRARIAVLAQRLNSFLSRRNPPISATTGGSSASSSTKA